MPPMRWLVFILQFWNSMQHWSMSPLHLEPQPWHLFATLHPGRKSMCFC
jgi:hypothetical protein